MGLNFRLLSKHLYRILFTLICFIFLRPDQTWAQGAPALIRTDPAVIEIAPGEVEEVSIVLENVFEAYGIDVRMDFDPSMVEIVDENPDLNGIQIQKGDFPKPDFPVLFVADNEVGTIAYVITQTQPTLPASGSGTVFKIRMRGLAEDQSTLAFSKVEISNRDGFLLDISTQNGQVIPLGNGSNITPENPILLPSATPPQGSQSAASATPENTEINATSVPASPTAEATNLTSPANPTATATLIPTQAVQPTQQATVSSQADTGNNSNQSSDSPVATAVVDSQSDNGIDPVDNEESNSQTENTVSEQPVQSQESETEANPTSQAPQQVVEQGSPATPETIGGGPSSPDPIASDDSNIVSDETQQSEQPRTEVLFIGAIIFLLLVLIGLLVLLAKRRSST